MTRISCATNSAEKIGLRLRIVSIVGGLLFCVASICRSEQVTNDLYVASFDAGGVTRLNGATGASIYDAFQGFSAIDLTKGPDGALYVTNLWDSSVVRVDPATGAPLGVFASGGELSTAVGIAFGPDGNLYVGSRNSHSVVRFNGSTGAFIDTYVAPDSGGLADTESLLFGSNGDLYVTEFSGNRVLRYAAATGAFLDVFATDPSLSYARSMAFGVDGNLYVAGTDSDNVVRFDGSTGAFLDVFTSAINGANGLAFGPDGNLYVAAEADSKIVRIDRTTGAIIDDFATVTAPIGIYFDVSTVPEPSTFILATLGLIGAAIYRRRAVT